MLAYLSKHVYAFLFLFLSISLQVEAETGRYRCMWREDPSTTMTIGWDQMSGSNPVIFFDEFDGGQDYKNYSQSKSPDKKVLSKGMNNHFVRLTNLKPNTTYYFIIKDNEGMSRQMSFKTLPDNPYERLSIIAGGDSRNHRKARQKANLLVSKLRPHAVMFGGDMTGGDIAKQWTAWMDDWQRTITNDGQLIPIIPARGNHEKSNQSLVDLFDVKNEKIHYALNLGGSLLRVYTLNSMIAAGGDQKAWLESDLNRNSHIKWKMAQYHHAIRPHNSKKSERNSQLKNWANLFYKYGVDLVCESDSHVAKTTYPIRPSKESGSEEGFIRDDVNGTVYIGEGCWGAPLRRNNDDKSWTRASGSFNQFKWIFVDLDGIEVRTVKVDNAEQVEAVMIDDLFTAPNGLDVWNPSTGSVIRIGGSPMYASTNDSNFSPSYSNQPPPAGATKPKRLAPPSIPEMEDIVKIEEPTTYLQSSGGTSVKKLMDIKPIEIHDFVVQEIAGEVVVQWSTKNEYLKPVFELQRSFNGNDYQVCARIHGAGSLLPEIKNNYKYRDNMKQLNISDLPLYRLQYTLENGESKSFQARMISDSKGKWTDLAKLTSNPKTGQIKFKYKLQQPSDVSIKLINSFKQQVLSNEFKNVNGGNFLQSLDLSKMAKGEYLLIIEANQKIIQQYKVEKRM